VSSGLESTSYFSVIPQNFTLSKREAARHPYVASQGWKAKPFERKLRLSAWKRVTADADDKYVTWAATATVLVSPQLGDSAFILPTFRSPLVSRRYSLDVKVKLRSQREYLTHSTLDLKVPVQILYSSPGRTSKKDS
jgi:hypothetical protein